jgi:hypothetical protein
MKRTTEITTLYREADLERLKSAVADIVYQLEDQIEHLEKHDTGTCVTSDGFWVNYLPPRKRKSRRLIILSKCQISRYQQELSPKSQSLIMKELKKRGIDASYYCGVMD